MKENEEIIEEPVIVVEVEEVKADKTAEETVLKLTTENTNNELFKDDNFDRQLAFLDILVKGKYLPEYIKTKETAFSIAQMGKELGIAPMAAFNNIIPINYKLTLSVKLQGALLNKGDVFYEVLHYGALLYNVEGERKISEAPLYPLSSKEHQNYYISKITTIRFERMVEFNGEKRLKTVETSFTMIEAEQAGLTNKDNWKKHPLDMLFARCLGRGSNIIAPDLMMGMYNTIEISDS